MKTGSPHVQHAIKDYGGSQTSGGKNTWSDTRTSYHGIFGLGGSDPSDTYGSGAGGRSEVIMEVEWDAKLEVVLDI